MITFDGVTKIYKGDVIALREVDIKFERGEFVFLVGPSGSGKSTFLRLLLREEVRRNVGCIFQDFKLLPNRTVYENIAFAQEVVGRTPDIIKSQVPKILELVGLEEKSNRFPDELSGGEQQRVSIARAFVNRPLILLADEPTGNLDPKTADDIMKLLDTINKNGTTVVMATHDVRIVNQMRKRVVQLKNGVIVRDVSSGEYQESIENVPQS